jgi:hypothetical protein
VTVTFSEPVTTSAQHLTLVDTSTEAAVASVITFDPMASRAVLNPVDDLDLDRTYRVHVDPLIRDVAGNLIVPTEWSFRTAPPTTYVPLNPARVVDTRNGNGLSGVFSASQPRTFTVAGRGSIPATAIAVSGTLTVTGQTHAGYLSLGPDPISAPTSSTLNFPVGDTRATGVTVALGPGGTLSATYSAPGGATTHLVFDVTGYFVMAGP